MSALPGVVVGDKIDRHVKYCDAMCDCCRTNEVDRPTFMAFQGPIMGTMSQWVELGILGYGGVAGSIDHRRRDSVGGRTDHYRQRVVRF